MAKQKGKSTRKAKPSPEYNGWRVLAIFIEGLFNLINNNKIYPAFGLFLLGIFSLIVWRLPGSELAEILKILINEVLVGKGSLIVIIVVTNVGWAYMLKRIREVYQNEIDRLANVRKELLHHGSESPLIKEHRSTNGDCKESYLIPDREEKSGK